MLDFGRKLSWRKGHLVERWNQPQRSGECSNMQTVPCVLHLNREEKQKFSLPIIARRQQTCGVWVRVGLFDSRYFCPLVNWKSKTKCQDMADFNDYKAASLTPDCCSQSQVGGEWEKQPMCVHILVPHCVNLLCVLGKNGVGVAAHIWLWRTHKIISSSRYWIFLPK